MANGNGQYQNSLSGGSAVWSSGLAGDLLFALYFDTATSNGNAAGSTLTYSLSISGGAATGAATAQGATQSITLSLAAGSATGSATANGISQSIAFSLTPAAATGSANATGDNITVTYSFVGGAGQAETNASAPGASVTITYTFTGGRARQFLILTSGDWNEALSVASNNWVAQQSISSGTRGQSIEIVSGDWDEEMGGMMAYDRDAVLKRVYDEMAEGKSVDKICEAEDLPEARTVYRWLVDESKCQEYARAKEVRADRMADDIVKIADDRTMNPEDRKIAIDARKWRAGKLHGKYSDKVKHVGGDEDDAPIRTQVDVSGLSDEQLAALASIKL